MLVVAGALLATLVLGSGTAAEAHVRSTTGYLELTGRGPDVDASLSLDYRLLAGAVGLGEKAVAAHEDGARAAALARGAGKIEAYVGRRMQVYVDDVACDAELLDTGLVQREGTPYATLDLAYDCPGTSGGSHRLNYHVFSETDAVVDDHTTVVEYHLGDETGRAVLDRAHPELTVGEGAPLLVAGRFLLMGGEHILFGLDHVLFVVALLLGSRRFRDVVAVATVFTVAHSVTLLLTALGLLAPPGWLVEPLIALSIAFVALDNLLSTRPGRQRLAVVFGFGLLHGLGFGSSLRVDDEFSWSLLTSLLTFNVGVEVGQALVILVVFPLLLRLRRSSWSGGVLTASTLCVAVVALVWFFQRVSLG